MIYQPAEDSYLLEKEVAKYSQGRKVLDMGSGSGIQSRAAVSSGALSVLAVDIDKECVKYLKNKGIATVQSDLFSKVKGKFDLIIFNPPYLPLDVREDLESQRITTGGKKGDEIILKFIKKAERHLEKKGIILLIISSLTPKKKIKSVLKTISMNFEVIAISKLFMETLEVWKISREE